MADHKFITPVAIKIESEDQRDRLVKRLVGLGYQGASASQDVQRFPMLVVEDDCYLMLTEPYRKSSYPSTILVQSEACFLALAAMTDKPEGIAGEWWHCYKYPPRTQVEVGRIYQAARPLSEPCAIINQYGAKVGSYTNNLDYFRKATVEEILKHFNEENMSEEKKMDLQMNTVVSALAGEDAQIVQGSNGFTGIIARKETREISVEVCEKVAGLVRLFHKEGLCAGENLALADILDPQPKRCESCGQLIKGAE